MALIHVRRCSGESATSGVAKRGLEWSIKSEWDGISTDFGGDVNYHNLLRAPVLAR
jgi:hypothetical protein